MNKIEEQITTHDCVILPNGHTIVTNTFFADFTIAERIGGENAIRDTYSRAVESWGESIEYLTALYIALNLKIWKHEGTDLCQVYSELYEKLYRYINKKGRFNKMELEYFYCAID